MKIGVCIVTCDRPLYLKDCIASLSGYDELVVVDNGSCTGRKVQRVVSKSGGTYINGNESNSPHGQNLGLHNLAEKGCDVVLKSDDDLLYDEGYIAKLLEVFRNRDNVGAVCGVCWDKTTDGYIHRVDDLFFSDIGTKMPGSTEQCIAMYRTEKDEVVEMRHLYGAFLYDVKAALQLEKETMAKRGGAFGEYFSHVAFREETEFTFLLRAITGRKLYFRTGAKCYHYKAPGGIRPHVRELTDKVGRDEENAKAVFNVLDIDWQLEPMQTGEVYAASS